MMRSIVFAKRQDVHRKVMTIHRLQDHVVEVVLSSGTTLRFAVRGGHLAVELYSPHGALVAQDGPPDANRFSRSKTP